MSETENQRKYVVDFLKEYKEVEHVIHSNNPLNKKGSLNMDEVRMLALQIVMDRRAEDRHQEHQSSLSIVYRERT